MMKKLKERGRYDNDAKCERKECRANLGESIKSILSIKAPYPSILNLGFNWNVSHEEVKAENILNFLLSLQNQLKISDIFEIEQRDYAASLDYYSIRSIVCYVGAHYLVFMKASTSSQWTLFNDSSIKHFQKWIDVVEYCIDTKCIPTMLVLEKGRSSGSDFILYSMDKDSLRAKAREQDQFLGQMMDNESFLIMQEREMESIRRTSTKVKEDSKTESLMMDEP